jgi:hypothetical protein
VVALERSQAVGTSIISRSVSLGMKKRYFLLPLALALAAIGSAHAQLPCTTPISSFPYNENFDSGPGGWTSAIVSGTANAWELGTPAKPVINSAFSGPNSWITGLTAAYSLFQLLFVGAAHRGDEGLVERGV